MMKKMNKDQIKAIIILLAVIIGSIAISGFLVYWMMEYPREAIFIALTAVIGILLITYISRAIIRKDD